EYLSSLKPLQIDTLFLGCTHYPLLMDLLRKEVGEEVMIIDSASACADKIAHILSNLDIAVKEPVYHEPSFHVSKNPRKFGLLAEEFLGFPLKHIECVSLHDIKL